MKVHNIKINHQQQQNENSKLVKVFVHAMILTIHDIDTVNERFTVEFYIQSQWNGRIEFHNTKPDFMLLGQHWKPTKWRPQLQIENIVSELKSDVWYKVENVGDEIFIYEMKRIKAIIYEKMELESYPFDIQPLNITLVSAHSSFDCELVNDETKITDVVVHTFRDSQEWYLYRYMAVQAGKAVKMDYTTENISYPSITFSCVVARRPFYFILNAFFLAFLINAISFNIFSIPYTTPASRLSTQFGLILTSVSFKWVVNRNLPPIAYLTTLDLYSIFTITFMAVLVSWHGIIATYHKQLNGTTDPLDADTIFCITAGVVFIACHIWFILSLFFGIYEKRRNYLSLEAKFIKIIEERNSKSKPIIYEQLSHTNF